MDDFFESARVFLRPLAAEDLDDLFDLDSDPEVMRYLTGGKPTPREEMRTVKLPRVLAIAREHPGLGFFAVVEKASGAFVGWFHLRPYRGDPAVLELGYRLRREHWGRGLATEVSRVLVRYGFNDKGASRIVAEAMADNGASIRVMEKVGMQREDRWCDDAGVWHVRYGMGKEGQENLAD